LALPQHIGGRKSLADGFRQLREGEVTLVVRPLELISLVQMR